MPVTITTLCLKNVPPLTCYNLDIRHPIAIIFGSSVMRKWEIRQYVVFPPHLSGASALPCERGNTEDTAWCFVHATQSSCCSAVDFLWDKSPKLNAVNTRFRVIQQREHESWVNNVVHNSQCCVLLGLFCKIRSNLLLKTFNFDNKLAAVLP